MEACLSPRPFVARPPLRENIPKPNPKPILLGRTTKTNNARAPTRILALDGAVDLPPVELTWQIAVGALAGVTPFVIAGIEFGKRIAAQRRCAICGGSGLVQREGYYARCPGCGGFLPWQSWKRFFTG